MKIYSIALCRVSTLEQATEGHSLERQEENVIRASERLNAPILRTWRIDQSSRSGKNLKRKDLQEMLEFCKHNNSVKYLIFDEIDRFMRSIDEYFYFKVEFLKLGVKFYVASDETSNEDSSVGKFNRVIKIYQAEMSNDERILKCTNGLKARVVAGYNPFHPHPGYKRTDTPGLHVPDPMRFTMLQKTIREVLSREFTLSEALGRLNDNSYRTLAGRKLQIDKFIKILKEPFYAGIIRIKDWPESKGLHQPMVTWSEYEQLQEIITGRKVRPYKKGNPDFPLNRIMTCVCGGKLTGFWHVNGSKKGWKRAEYRCRGCGKQYIRENVHNGLDDILKEIALDNNNEEKFVKALKEVWREEQQVNIKHIETLERRSGELKNKKNQLAIALVTENDYKQDIKEALEKIKTEISMLESQITEAKNIEKDLVEFIHFALNFTHSWKSEWWELKNDYRVKCKELLFPQGFSINHNKKVYTAQISPLYRFVTTKKEPDLVSDSHLVEPRGIAPLSKKRFNNC